MAIKSDSLCGKQSCPSICVRVCHCPAGLARSRTLAGMLRNRREISRPRPSPGLATPEARTYDTEFIPEDRTCALSPNLTAVDPNTGEILDPRHSFGALNQPEHGKPTQHLPTHNFKQTRPYGTSQSRLWASTAILTALLAFIGICVIVGITLNQGDFCPDYKPPQIYSQDAG